MLSEKFSTVESKIENLGFKFEKEILELNSKINFFITSQDAKMKAQTDDIQNALFLSESFIRTDLKTTANIIGKGFTYTKESLLKMNSKINGNTSNENENVQLILPDSIGLPSATPSFKSENP